MRSQLLAKLIRPPNTFIKLLFFASVSVLLVSCETVSFYTQAARGQLAIVFAREDIRDLLDDSALTPRLREKFSTLLAIREFAEAELSLPVAENYLTYVDVEREHVVWNVFAAPEFSVDPVTKINPSKSVSIPFPKSFPSPPK